MRQRDTERASERASEGEIGQEEEEEKERNQLLLCTDEDVMEREREEGLAAMPMKCPIQKMDDRADDDTPTILSPFLLLALLSQLCLAIYTFAKND